jgi:hypothetical protein
MLGRSWLSRNCVKCSIFRDKTPVVRCKNQLPFRKNMVSPTSIHLLHAFFFLVIFLDPEDGGDVFLWNVCYFQRTTRRCIPEDRTLHNHRCENFKYYTEIAQFEIFIHQEFPKILSNRKVYYRVHSDPPLVPTRNQINPIHPILFL